jgi:hypothetical protein
MRNIRLEQSFNYYLRDKFNKIKARAKKDKTPFNLTLEYFISLYVKQKGICYYFDIPLEKGNISLDRIDPTKGYIKGNIIFCSVKANTIKSNLTLNELSIWIPKFYKKIKELYMDKLDSNAVTLSFCGCNPPGCPTLTVDTNTNTIMVTDDFNGSVKMSIVEFETLMAKYIEHTGGNNA